MGELFLVDRETADARRETAVLKRLLPGADDAHRALFAREGDVLAQLDSPNIVRLLDRGPGWLLLEHVDGVDLATLLAHRARRGRPLPLPATWALLGGLCAALSDLHEATAADGTALGLVHRDVNPANVLLSRDGAVKLIDLGVVRTALTDAATVAGVKGTLAYMAPEQLHGRPAGPAADVYAAALVAYEALTGVPARPQGAAVGLAELLAARDRLPAPPSSLRSTVPPAVDAAVLAALAPDPNARTASARGFGEQLLAAAGQAPAPGALAKAVERVCDAEAPSTPAASRTLVALSDGASATAGEGGSEPGDAPARRSRWPRVIAAAIALGAVAGVTAFVLPRDVPPLDRAPLTATGAPPDAAARDDDITETMPPEDAATAPDLSVEDTAPPVLSGVSPTGDAGAAVTEVDADVPAPTDVVEALEARPADAASGSATDTARIRRRDTRPPVPAPLALTVDSGARGPVYVVGSGARGATPQRTDPIAAGGAASVSIERRLRAHARRRGDALTIRFTSEDKTLYVDCGTGRRQLVDTATWSVPPGGLRCEAQGREGAVISFRLAAGAP